jgi:hypothetical protein
MAETMNGKVQLAAARVEVPAKLNDADALKPLPYGMRRVQHGAAADFQAATERCNRLIPLAD